MDEMGFRDKLHSSNSELSMSALGQKQTFAVQEAMSAMGQKRTLAIIQWPRRRGQAVATTLQDQVISADIVDRLKKSASCHEQTFTVIQSTSLGKR